MKKTLTLLTACALALSITACGASGGDTAADGGQTATQAPAKKSNGEFPTDTITLVCPFSAGGGTDIGARNMATALSNELGVNVVVENQTGSGGWVAWTDLITGDYSDGYTIGLINHNYAMGELDDVNPREYNLDDVQMLCNQAIDYNVMAIRSNESRFTDLDSFIEYGKSNPVIVSAQATGITDGDRILLTKYARSGYNHYALVAGFCEIGESFEETLRREVAEEVGLEVENIRYWNSQPWSFSDSLLAGFFCDVRGSRTPRLVDGELKEASWFSRAEIPVSDDGVSLTRAMIEAFRQGKA